MLVNITSGRVSFHRARTDFRFGLSIIKIDPLNLHPKLPTSQSKNPLSLIKISNFIVQQTEAQRAMLSDQNFLHSYPAFSVRQKVYRLINIAILYKDLKKKLKDSFTVTEMSHSKQRAGSKDRSRGFDFPADIRLKRGSL